LILCRVLLHSGNTLVIPHENESSLEYFKREVTTQSNPESFFYSWEQTVRVKDIAEIVSIEEEIK